MLRILLFLTINFIGVKAVCQYLPTDMKDGLKGKLRLLETIDYYKYPDGLLTRQVDVFDAKGHFVIALLYDDSDRLSSYFTFQYDKANRLISYNNRVDKTITEKLVNVYDAGGKVVLQKSFLYHKDSATELRRRIFTYNKSILPVKVYVEQWGIDICPFYRYYTYNAKGQKITDERTGQPLSSGYKTSYTYNAKGEVAMEIGHETEKNVPQFLDTLGYEYKNYDKNGNWRRRDAFRLIDGSKEYDGTRIRKIRYFKN